VLLVALLGFSTVTAVLGAVFFGLSLLYVVSAAGKQKNQIKWNLHPLFDAEKLLVLPLTLIIASSFSLGYMNDASRRHFILPPEIKQMFMTSVVQKTIDQNFPKASVAERKVVFEKAKPQIEELWKSIEDGFKPLGPFMPLVLGALMFFVLESALLIISFVPLILLSILFLLLRLARVTRYQAETVEAKRLVLD